MNSLNYLQGHLLPDHSHSLSDWWSPIFALSHGNRHPSLLSVGDEEGRVTTLSEGSSAQISLDDAVFDLQWSPDDDQLVRNLNLPF